MNSNQPLPKQPRPGSPSRREFLTAGVLIAAATMTPGTATQIPPPASVRPFELEELNLADLQAGLAANRWSSRKLTELYLERIEALDQRGPALRSFLELNPDAIAIAKQRDAERKTGHVRSPLHGVPIVLKDNLETGDRTHTTAGSLALAGSFALRDAFIVARLREMGAVVLGKTNLSEWANFRSSRSSSGWSARGGQCRNPYVLDRNPCGSSSGTAVAVAANLATVGLGTETDGSIVCPAGRCGLVGLKPTVGRLSRSGIIPISRSQDTAGPMTRTVADAAQLFAVLAGRDSLDPATEQAPKEVLDPRSWLDRNGLRGRRLGVLRQFPLSQPEAQKLWEAALADLRSLGAELVDLERVESLTQIGDAEYTVLLHEFKAGLNDYLATLPASVPVRSLAELIRFNEQHAAQEMPFFGQEIFLEAESKGPLTDSVYREARAKALRLSRTEGLDRVLQEHQLDALVAPTGGPAWPIDLVNGDRFTGGSSEPAAVSGYPNLTVPAGQVHGLPVGLSFMGGPWSEPLLLRCAYAYEQATRHRRVPRFLPTVA